MNIVVCVKHVNGDINPFDACALECALQVENANITIISMGRKDVADMLQRLTRLGANRVILLCDNAFAGADTLATAYTLSLVIKKINPDLIFCGRQSIDGDTAQVGPCLAATLNIPVITNALEIKNISEGKIECATRCGDEISNFPALVTIERINTLRFPSLRSRAKDVEVLTAADIGADLNKCGLKGSPTRVLKTFENTIGRRKCKFIEPDGLKKAIKFGLSKPHNELVAESSGVKLPLVWCVGDEPVTMAKTIADNIRVIEKGFPSEIANLIKSGSPNVVLWDSGIWGRKTAPQVASMLHTGLCADCTMLETDGEQLFMYRPALGGSIMAKIKCLTRPQMATVRSSENKSEDVIVSVGLGATEYIESIKLWAKNNGYAFAASRALVDKGMAPYSCQIGLTGRAVSPKVYIAFGISGAVQHTCGIEQAGMVIAINSDRNSRIWDYADYGILTDIKNINFY